MKILNIMIFLLLILLVTLIWNKSKGLEIKEKENEANNKENFKKEIYEKRMKWLYGYLVFSIAIFGLFFVIEWSFENIAKKILFCFASTALGFFICGHNYRIASKDDPFPKYSLYYPLIIIIFTAFSFSVTTIILKVFNISDTIIFYTLALSLSLYCSHHVDNITKLGDKINIKKS
ncbi:MAG: hypothetical protein ABIC04_06940 [Nanoarchaeota archaeon]